MKLMHYDIRVTITPRDSWSLLSPEDSLELLQKGGGIYLRKHGEDIAFFSYGTSSNTLYAKILLENTWPRKKGAHVIRKEELRQWTTEGCKRYEVAKENILEAISQVLIEHGLVNENNTLPTY